jgi:hypothetical protein
MVGETRQAMRAICNCGTCSIETTRLPTARLKCHCTICQAFTASPYSDVAVIPASHAVIGNESLLDFRKYKRIRFPPPNLKRGRCRNCGQPFVEIWGSGLLRIFFMRAVTFERPELLLPVGAHVFYEHHVDGAVDDIPKYEGYFRSQLAIGKIILRAM